MTLKIYIEKVGGNPTGKETEKQQGAVIELAVIKWSGG